MEPQFYISTFTRKTFQEFKDSGMKRGGSAKLPNRNLRPGDIGLCVDKDSSEILAVTRLGKFDDGLHYREKHLLDAPVYESAAKYEKYETKLDACHVFPRPVTFERFCNYIGGDDKVCKLLNKRKRLSHVRIFETVEYDSVRRNLIEYVTQFI